MGLLAPGKRAEFIMLDGEPLNTETDSIKDITVLGTWLGGKQTHRA